MNPKLKIALQLAALLALGFVVGQVFREGIILASPQGDGGFGYDPLFFMPPFGKTLAEMTVAEKNSVSHRGQGLRIMTAKLKEYWSC